LPQHKFQDSPKYFMDLQQLLRDLGDHAEGKIKQAQSLAELEAFQLHFLGRKGELALLMKKVAEVSKEERPIIGALANEVKGLIERHLEAAHEQLGSAEINAQLVEEQEDITEPGIRPPEGHIHVINQAIEEITDIFERAGFSRTRQPEVDWDWYAFEALNMPKEHPARDEWETFFMDAPISSKWGKMLLTPHATSGTARTLAQAAPRLKKEGGSIRSINIAKTYRRQIDITHVPMFHQFDGVYVNKQVSVTHLLGILDYFVKEFFGQDRRTRLRPFHFRFTEPSFEIDISCGVCNGSGKINGEKCRTCKDGWLELGGAGMLHPNVLEAANIDSKTYSALAFGWGVERTYMMKEGLQLDDMRLLYKNDLRFLKQF